MADLCILTADNSRYERVEDILEDIRGSVEKAGGNYILIPDRREAIAYSIRHAQEGDMIAVISKGHEDYQIFKDGTIHFSDREICCELLGIELPASQAPAHETSDQVKAPTPAQPKAAAKAAQPKAAAKAKSDQSATKAKADPSATKAQAPAQSGAKTAPKAAAKTKSTVKTTAAKTTKPKAKSTAKTSAQAQKEAAKEQ